MPRTSKLHAQSSATAVKDRPRPGEKKGAAAFSVGKKAAFSILCKVFIGADWSRNSTAEYAQDAQHARIIRCKIYSAIQQLALQVLLKRCVWQL